MTTTQIAPLSGTKFYVLQGDGQPTEAFTFLCLATTVDSDHSADVEDAMLPDATDPTLPAVRASAVKGRTWDITISGLVDPLKLARLRTLYDAGTPGNFQLMKNVPGAQGGFVEQGAFLVTAMKETMADRGLVKFSVTLHGQGRPTETANA